jgi:hypothetical protein
MRQKDITGKAFICCVMQGNLGKWKNKLAVAAQPCPATAKQFHGGIFTGAFCATDDQDLGSTYACLLAAEQSNRRPNKNSCLQLHRKNIEGKPRRNRRGEAASIT